MPRLLACSFHVPVRALLLLACVLTDRVVTMLVAFVHPTLSGLLSHFLVVIMSHVMVMAESIVFYIPRTHGVW